jgi:hypothetical protein
VAVWLLANGHYATATLLFLSAKVASTALIARVFVLTKPSLMQIGWFARAYNWFQHWKDALFAQIRSSWAWRYGRMLKTRIKLDFYRTWTRLEPRIAEQWHRWTGRELSFGRGQGAFRDSGSQERPSPKSAGSTTAGKGES